VQPDARAVEASGQEVVDREVDPGRVELLEDCADSADRLAVGVVDAWQLDERHLEGLECAHSGGPAVPPLRAVAVLVLRFRFPLPVFEAVAPIVKGILREERGAGQNPLLVLGLDLVEPAKLAFGSIEDDFVAVWFGQEDV